MTATKITIKEEYKHPLSHLQPSFIFLSCLFIFIFILYQSSVNYHTYLIHLADTHKIQINEVTIFKIIKLTLINLQNDSISTSISTIQSSTRLSMYTKKSVYILHALFPLLQHLAIGIMTFILFLLVCYFHANDSVKRQVYNKLPIKKFERKSSPLNQSFADKLKDE